MNGVKISLIFPLLMGVIFNINAQFIKENLAMSGEALKVKEIVNSKKSITINPHGLPTIKEEQIEKILSQATTVCLVEVFDVLTTHAYRKLIQRSDFDEKLYLVYIGGTSGNDKHVFGPLFEAFK